MDEWGQGPWGDLTWLRTTGPDTGNRRKERTVNEDEAQQAAATKATKRDSIRRMQRSMKRFIDSRQWGLSASFYEPGELTDDAIIVVMRRVDETTFRQAASTGSAYGGWDVPMRREITKLKAENADLRRRIAALVCTCSHSVDLHRERFNADK